MSALDFKVISVLFKVRDAFIPRIKVLDEVGIKPGFIVLDYGCGPGCWIFVKAEGVILDESTNRRLSTGAELA